MEKPQTAESAVCATRLFVLVFCFHRHSRFVPPIFAFSRIASGSRPNLVSSSPLPWGEGGERSEPSEGFFPSSLATSEFGFNSRIWCSNLGSFWVRFGFVLSSFSKCSLCFQ
jgi:hypothetical protein